MEACGVLWFAAAHIHDIDLQEIKHLKLMICVASFDLKQLLVRDYGNSQLSLDTPLCGSHFCHDMS